MKKYLQSFYLYAVGALSGAANGLFGSGGGIITVPMLEHDGMRTKKAHATSIAVTLPLSIISGVIYFSKGAIDLAQAWKFIPCGLIGVFVGSKLLVKLSGITLKRIFGAVMIVFGIRLWKV